MQQEHQKLLVRLLKLPQNSVCADCGSKSPSCKHVPLGRGLARLWGVCLYELLGRTSRSRTKQHQSQIHPTGYLPSRLGQVVDHWKLSPSASLEERHRYLIEKYIKRRFSPPGETDPITLLKEGRYASREQTREGVEQSKQQQPPKIQSRPPRQCSQQPVRSDEKPKTMNNWNQFLNPSGKTAPKKLESAGKQAQSVNPFVRIGNQHFSGNEAASKQQHKPATTQTACFDVFTSLGNKKEATVHKPVPPQQKNLMSFDQPQIHHNQAQNPQSVAHNPHPPIQQFHTYSGGYSYQAHYEKTTWNTGMHNLHPHNTHGDMFNTVTPTSYLTNNWSGHHQITPPLNLNLKDQPIVFAHEQPANKPKTATTGGLIDNFNEFA